MGARFRKTMENLCPVFYSIGKRLMNPRITDILPKNI